MPSPAERRFVERALRTAALALLGWLLFGAFRAPAAPSRHTGPAPDRAALAAWTTAPPADSLQLLLDRVPGPETRAWLGALAGAGTAVVWAVSDLAAVGVEVETVHGPRAEWVVRIGGDGDAWAVVSDALGPVDSVTVGARGAVVRAGGLAGPVTVRGPEFSARAAVPPTAPARRIAVFGVAGWEARFVVTALEEEGWDVDARIALAPDLAAVTGRPLPLDTARHAVAILLDGADPGSAGAVGRFVRSGGGLVVAGIGDRGSGIGGLLPGRPDAVRRATALRLTDGDPLAALRYRPLAALRDDAVALGDRRGGVVFAARREGAGRVVYVGYDETWRWRMTGGADAPAAHRRWWAGVVSAAAGGDGGPVPERMLARDTLDPAPVASLSALLGPHQAVLPDPRSPIPDPPYQILLALAVACLLAEWASRRLRGLP